MGIFITLKTITENIWNKWNCNRCPFFIILVFYSKYHKSVYSQFAIICNTYVILNFSSLISVSVLTLKQKYQMPWVFQNLSWTTLYFVTRRNQIGKMEKLYRVQLWKISERHEWVWTSRERDKFNAFYLYLYQKCMIHLLKKIINWNKSVTATTPCKCSFTIISFSFWKKQIFVMTYLKMLYQRVVYIFFFPQNDVI